MLFGATGMVGQGALRECLADTRVEAVCSVGRSACGESHPKLREILLPDLFDLSSVADDLSGFDACLYCLGASPGTLNARAYRRVTVDLTLSVAHFLAPRNPGMTFVYVSGAGVDGSRPGTFRRIHTLGAKGEVEEALKSLPFRAVYMMRPGLIRPLDGIRSRTFSHRLFYTLAEPLMPLLVRLFPGFITDTRRLGRAMIRAAAEGFPRAALETRDINGV
jgi:nucleoside-diphosphate-sugar epimerase